jgi:hypothetical protein
MRLSQAVMARYLVSNLSWDVMNKAAQELLKYMICLPTDER